MKYFKEAQQIWKEQVPADGQADTVQGELLRAVEKLRDEAQRNGNTNWDQGHEILVAFLKQKLLYESSFNEATKSEIQSDLKRILDYVHPETTDELYDRLADKVVEWALAHPEPVPHKKLGVISLRSALERH